MAELSQDIAALRPSLRQRVHLGASSAFDHTLNMIGAGRAIRLSQPAFTQRFIDLSNGESPALRRKAEACELVESLIEDEDWISLAELMEEWDQQRVSGPTGVRMTEYGLQQTVTSLVKLVGEVSKLEPILERLEATAALQPTLYMIPLICAHLRSRQAWEIQGNTPIHAMGFEDQKEVDRLVARARWLLAETNAQKNASPLAAAITFEMLSFLQDAELKVQPLYEEWSRLDPHDQTPHREFAFYMLPRWYGSYVRLEHEARQAAQRTEGFTGSSAYASFYRGVLISDPEAIFTLDETYFFEGVESLIRMRGKDPSFIANIVQDLYNISHIKLNRWLNRREKSEHRRKCGLIRNLARDAIREKLTGIHEPSWVGGRAAALDYISDAFQIELHEGSVLRLTESGIEVVSKT